MNIKRNTKWTHEDFIKAVQNNFSLAGVLRELGLRPSGANYGNSKLYIKKHKIDISHFTGQAHLKGKTHNWAKKSAIEDLFIENGTYCSSRLSKRIRKDKLKDFVCGECGVGDKWNNKPLVLHIDHINGVGNDNRLENLRFLCPNCHSQTESYCGKNKGIRSKKILNISPAKPDKITKLCLDCQKEISDIAERCKSCAGRFREPTKIEWPLDEELAVLVSTHSLLALGKKLGVSDNAIRKRCKSKGIKLN